MPSTSEAASGCHTSAGGRRPPLPSWSCSTAAAKRHTWDTVALALGRPAVAFDLPGHGRSSRRADRDYGPWSNAEAVAAAMVELAPSVEAVVGMSLGGATLIRLAATRPDLVRRAVIVDVTPQAIEPTGP